MSSLRHPLVTSLGVLLFLFAAASDAVGSRACAHHAHGEHGGEHGEVQAHGDHHGHDGHHGHDEPGESEPDCDCGFLCVAMSGPPPVEPAVVVVLPGLDTPPVTPVERVSVEDPRVRAVLIPHLLPFSQGPPLQH